MLWLYPYRFNPDPYAGMYYWDVAVVMFTTKFHVFINGGLASIAIVIVGSILFDKLFIGLRNLSDRCLPDCFRSDAAAMRDVARHIKKQDAQLQSMMKSNTHYYAPPNFDRDYISLSAMENGIEQIDEIYGIVTPDGEHAK